MYYQNKGDYKKAGLYSNELIDFNFEELSMISGGLTAVLESREATFKKADEKLYISKKSGKNRITG